MPGTPSPAETGKKPLGRMLLAVTGGVTCRREVLQGIGEGRVLQPGQPAEPEAAPGHEVRCAPEPMRPPDHGTPDHLRGEVQISAGREEAEGARGAGSEQGNVLDLRAGAAQVEEVDSP